MSLGVALLPDQRDRESGAQRIAGGDLQLEEHSIGDHGPKGSAAQAKTLDFPAIGFAGIPGGLHDFQVVIAGDDAGQPGIADACVELGGLFLNMSAATVGLWPAMTPSTLMPEASRPPRVIAARAGGSLACVVVIAGNPSRNMLWCQLARSRHAPGCGGDVVAFGLHVDV